MPRIYANGISNLAARKRRERFRTISIKPVPPRSKEWKSHNTECPICLEPHTEENPLDTRLSFYGKPTCNHTFHRRCISQSIITMKSAKCPCCRTGPIGRLEMKDGDHRLIAPDVRKCPPTMQIMEAFFELAHLKINRVMFIKQARQFENSDAFVFKKFNLDFHVCSCSEECNCSHMITSYYDFQAWFDNIPTSQKHPSLTVAKIAEFCLLPILRSKRPNVYFHLLLFNNLSANTQMFEYPIVKAVE